MKGTKLIIMALGAIFIFMLIMCESKNSDISDSTDDDNAQDDDDNDNNDDIVDDDSQFEDDDNGDDENDTDTFLDGCDGVDFLFVIDASRSMADEQQNLINSFPGFIDAITEAIDVNNYHIMAVDSDARYTPFGPPRQGCDSTLGAGHVGNNLGVNCSIQGGNRYLVKDQPNLDDAFACIAKVGTEGHYLELVMEAMVNAVGRENQQGGCNAGFIREKSLLVVTYITDESGTCDDMNSECSEGTPATWKQALVDAKQGHEEAVVVLGLFGDNDQPDKICTEYDDQGNGAVAAPILREFLESFDEDHRHYCSVCLPDYSDCFLEAVSIIDMACEDVE